MRSHQPSIRSSIRQLFGRADQWARGLSRLRYAVLLGASAATGVLIVGLVLSAELYVLQAVTMGVVLVALEYAFGAFQTPQQ